MKLREIALRVGGELEGGGEVEIRDVAELARAGPGELAFAEGPAQLRGVEVRAGALIAPPGVDAPCPILRHPHPKLAFARAVPLFRKPPAWRRGVDPRAYVAPGVRMGADPAIYAGAYLDEGVVLGDRVTVLPGAFLGAGVRVGDDTFIGPNVSLYPGVRLGARAVIHGGAVLGADGFGFVRNEAGEHEKFPQVGTVVVGDDVEVGANTAIDRASLGETRVGRGTKIDNLVQVGHNVVVGERCILVGQAGISGSCHLGDGVVLAGQAGVADGVRIAPGVTVIGQAGVVSDLKTPGGVYSGSPAMDHLHFRRVLAVLARLPELARRVRRLEGPRGEAGGEGGAR